MVKNECDTYWIHANYIYPKTAINWWCDKYHGCREAKEAALISAIINGAVSYRRSDFKSYDDPVTELYSRNLLLVGRISFFEWAKSISNNAEKARLNQVEILNPRAESTYLTIIGALTDLMLSKSAGGQKLSVYNSQADIIEALISHYPHKPGLSKRNLETKLAAGKLQLAEE